MTRMQYTSSIVLNTILKCISCVVSLCDVVSESEFKKTLFHSMIVRVYKRKTMAVAQRKTIPIY